MGEIISLRILFEAKSQFLKITVSILKVIYAQLKVLYNISI